MSDTSQSSPSSSSSTKTKRKVRVKKSSSSSSDVTPEDIHMTGFDNPPSWEELIEGLNEEEIGVNLIFLIKNNFSYVQFRGFHS
jgi:hypothetical protein